ncbi:MAG: pyroglutamyl-peptidase I, partial [Erysipelotrichaceae bacterium]|nr:pyroglutamyl-peptidase I [Erysipelotrichaceae bacterium]
PFLHEQVLNRKETASLSKDDVVKGIEAAIEAIVDSLS